VLNREDVGTDVLLLAMLDAGRGTSTKRLWRFLGAPPWQVSEILNHHGITWELVKERVGPRSLTPQVSRTSDEIAAKLVRRWESSLLSEKELVPVEKHDFPLLDAAFYDQTAAQLRQLGFHFIADLENLVSSKIYPEGRYFVRYLADESETVLAAIYELGATELNRFQALQAGKAYSSHKILALTSSIEPPRIIITTNSDLGQTLRQPPEFQVEHIRPGTPVAEQVAIHLARVQEFSGHGPTRIGNLEELLQFLRYERSITIRYRSSIDTILTREEMLGLLDRISAEQVDEVYEEILRIRKARTSTS
jgi:hypothetical protein